MEEMTEKQTKAKELLETFLKKIDWSLKHMGCNHYYVVNHKGVMTKWCLWDSHLSYDRDKYNDDDELFCVCFEIKESDVNLIDGDGDTVVIGPTPKKYPFILFMNHDKKKKDYAIKQEGVKE